jgi:hypothetical protein
MVKKCLGLLVCVAAFGLFLGIMVMTYHDRYHMMYELTKQMGASGARLSLDFTVIGLALGMYGSFFAFLGILAGPPKDQKKS